MAETSLIASLVTPPSPSGAELTALPESVDWLEVRADLVGDISPEWLRTHFKGRLLYSLRSSAEGGECSDDYQRRQDRLAAAATQYDRIEIESSRDISEALLNAIPFEKRLIGWHGPATDLAILRARFSQLSAVPAPFYKLVTTATRLSDEFAPLLLLKELGRADIVAYCNGPMGFWNRVAALHLGAPCIYGRVSSEPIAGADPGIFKLIQDYHLPSVVPAKALFAIVGDPVFHSLSPRLHNAAYREMHYPALFVPLRVESFAEFWSEVVQSKQLDALGMPIGGMTVASPHKEEALQTARIVSPMARQTESANILVRNNGWWQADTTDPDVIYMASRERNVKVRQKRAAVIGCGGAGRAIAAALSESGAGVTLINRGSERGRHAARLLGLPYVPLLDFDVEGYDIVVNATPVGRDSDEVPFNLEHLSDEVVVIDLVYGSRPTPLVGSTLARDQVVIDGRDVLLTQVHRQFRMMTDREMPSLVALETLGRVNPIVEAGLTAPPAI